jgi:serine/threonine-protein kinase
MAMTLYAAIARLPYSRRDMEQTMVAILREPLPSPSSLRPEVPEELDAILMRAAARKADERTPTAQALQLELEEWLATQPPVDVGAWVRDTAGPRAAMPPPPPLSDLSRTIPILDDVSLH